MEYTFQTNQLNILNVLIYDASISLISIENLKLVDNYVEFEIERRTHENVLRKKKIFWNFTYINGKTSCIRIENISELSVIGLTKKFNHNHFIINAETNSKEQLQITSTFGLTITFKTTSKFVITLRDIKDSKFGKGTIIGTSGYTKEEWRNFLISENFLKTI